MRGKGRRNTDRTSFADKSLSAWKGENVAVRSLAFLPCFRNFLPILSVSLSEKYSSLALFQVPIVIYGGIRKRKSRLKLFLLLQKISRACVRHKNILCSCGDATRNM